MKYFLVAATACLALSGAAMAQERSAGGVAETQMTWSALQTMVNAANTKSDQVNARIEKIVACGRLGKVYAPGHPSADANDCASASSGTSIQTNIDNLTNSVNYTGTNVTNLANTVNNILNCNKNSQFFNGSACVSVTAAAPTCSLKTSGWMNSGCKNSPRASCASGQQIINYTSDDCGGSSGAKTNITWRCQWLECN